MPAHQTSEHGTSHSLYHAPGIAPFAKNTIIPSRRGTLELRVHWFFLPSPTFYNEDAENWGGSSDPRFIQGWNLLSDLSFGEVPKKSTCHSLAI